MSRISKAVWIHNLPKESREVARIVAKRLADAGIDILIPCVKNTDGYIDYHGRVAAIRPAFAEWDPLAVLCDQARRVNLQVHPWNCVFTEGPGSRLLQEHPGYAALDPAGVPVVQGRYHLPFACSARPEVQAHELAIYTELMDNYDIDGVHLDYIRYHQATVGPQSCFCPWCREHFKQETGYEPSFDQATHAWSAWVDWKTAAITRFVEALRRAAKVRGKEVSAAVFPEYPECIHDIGQDWEDWGRRRLVDYIFPMNYTMNDTLTIKRTRSHTMVMNGTGVPVWEGLWNREAMSTCDLLTQVRGVLAAGAQGIVIFEYYSLSDEDLAALSKI